jgi:PAS domain S-box-containing protein
MADTQKSRWQKLELLTSSSLTLRYGGAIFLSLAFIALRWLVAHFILDDGHPFAALIIPVAVASFFEGLGPGLVSLLVTTALSDYFLIAPLYTIGFDNTRALSGTLWFAVAGLLIAVLGEASRRAILQSSSEADIRRAAQQQSLLNEERLQIAEQVVVGGVWEWNLVAGKAFWTDGYRRLFDYGLQEEPSREKWLERIHVDDRERVSGLMDDLITRKLHRWVTEYRVSTVSGRTRWISSHGRAFYDDQGRPKRMVGIDVDVTARRLAEDSARNNEAKMRLLMQYARVGDWEWHPESGEVRCSSELYEVLGMQPSASTTFEQLMSYVHPADALRVRTLLEQLQAYPGRDFEFDNRFVGPDKVERVVYTRGSVIPIDEPRKVVVVGITIDVSRRAKEMLAS